MKDLAWIVWHPEGGEDGPEDGRQYLAKDAEEAAQKWAEDYDKDEYPLSLDQDHSEVVKVILRANDPVVRTFAVRASISVRYSADEVTT